MNVADHTTRVHVGASTIEFDQKVVGLLLGTYEDTTCFIKDAVALVYTCDGNDPTTIQIDQAFMKERVNLRFLCSL